MSYCDPSTTSQVNRLWYSISRDVSIEDTQEIFNFFAEHLKGKLSKDQVEKLQSFTSKDGNYETISVASRIIARDAFILSIIKDLDERSRLAFLPHIASSKHFHYAIKAGSLIQDPDAKEEYYCRLGQHLLAAGKYNSVIDVISKISDTGVREVQFSLRLGRFHNCNNLETIDRAINVANNITDNAFKLPLLKFLEIRKKSIEDEKKDVSSVINSMSNLSV